MISDRLQKEFAATCTSQTQEIVVNGEEWNDGLLATVRERVHMEAHRKTMSGDFSSGTDSLEKITYKVGNKVICCLEGARIGIQCKTFFPGEPCEIYYIVLQGKSFIEKMSILEHTVPFVLPMREVENDLLSSNGMVSEIHRSYGGTSTSLPGSTKTDTCHFLRVHLIKGLYGNRIGDLYSSLPFHMIEFMLDDAEWFVYFIFYIKLIRFQKMLIVYLMLSDYFSIFNLQLMMVAHILCSDRFFLCIFESICLFLRLIPLSIVFFALV